jgi:hypothetical protein
MILVLVALAYFTQYDELQFHLSPANDIISFFMAE